MFIAVLILDLFVLFLDRRILEVHSADEFYTVMGVLTREMLTFGLMDANKLVQVSCSLMSQVWE